MRLIRVWREHRSNFVFFLIGSCGGGSVIGAIGHAIANDMHRHPTDWVFFSLFVIFGLVILAAGVWLLRQKDGSQNALLTGRQLARPVPGIPTLSALNGVQPEITFDAKTFFATAYYSPVTAEIEHNIKVIAHAYSSSNVESFYTRFIGIGYVSAQHDQTWLMIFGSQLRALSEMNARGLMALKDLKPHYAKAAAENPLAYKNSSFDQWISFLSSRFLVATYPSHMIEISHNGKDFLKYLAHTGRDFLEQPN